MNGTVDLCSPRCDLLDISGTLTEAASAIVDDSFTRCFKSLPPDPWNWNIYLFPLWCLCVVTRYLILFPARLIVIAVGWIIFLSCYPALHTLLKGHHKLRRKLEKILLQLFCGFFVASWNGVIKYHGPRPSNRPGQVRFNRFAFPLFRNQNIHHSAFGFAPLDQRTILESVGCIVFNRSEVKDREFVVKRMKEHFYGTENYPLLIFPEGTCVNNQYGVMFKKGAYEIGCTICPIAIKYNKIFSDPFWNSRKHSFTVHLFRIVTSWALVCDVYFLEPQNLNPGETPIEFAERVRDMICARAGLKKVDGMVS